MNNFAFLQYGSYNYYVAKIVLYFSTLSNNLMYCA